MGGGNYIHILINPFSKTASHTLPLEAYLKIMWLIGNMQNCIPVVATYPERHNDFISALEQWQNKTQLKIEKLLIFQNDNDVLKLAALIEQMNYVISPSTGTIHLASNLCVPTIGLFSQYDTMRWGTKSKQYVILPKPKADINIKEIETAIIQTMQILYKIITHKPQ